MKHLLSLVVSPAVLGCSSSSGTPSEPCELREVATIASPPETGLQRALAAHQAIVQRLLHH